jgi:hypothetical protein
MIFFCSSKKENKKEKKKKFKKREIGSTSTMVSYIWPKQFL